MTWEMLQLSQLAGFPLWEKDVHDVLAANLESLQSIFRAYAASSLGGSQNEMDMEEFHDFVIESDLITDAVNAHMPAPAHTHTHATCTCPTRSDPYRRAHANNSTASTR